jgi:hypothetical protein
MKEVSGKRCLEYLTRHWEKHPKRGKEKLRQFLLACFKLSRAESEEFEFFTRLKVPEPRTEKEREGWAKKTIAQIKCRGLDSLQLLMVSDVFDEWWNGEWKIDKRRFVRLKGEIHRRAKQNSQKGVESKKQKASKRETEALSRYIEECKKANAPLGFR